VAAAPVATPLNRPRSPRFRVLSICLAATLFFVTAFLGFITVRRLNDTRGWVLHTYEVRSDVRQLRESVVEVTGAVDATAATESRLPLSDMVQKLDAQFVMLRRIDALTGDNPAQQANLREARSLLSNFRALVERCVDGAVCFSGSPAVRREQLSAVWNQRQDILALFDSMERDEELLLNARLKRWTVLFYRLVFALSLSFLITLLLVFFSIRMLVEEISRRKETERSLRIQSDEYRALSARLLELQDSERRKIARELHDSVGQQLTGIKLQLGQIARHVTSNSPVPQALLADTLDLTDRSLNEIRTISHLLHPPLLDELGFYSAARWYAEGFAKRSGIPMNFQVDEFVDRLPRDVEIALFRVLQESLTNVHRHSGARHVAVDVSCKNDIAILLVEDDGRGIPRDALLRFHAGRAGGIGLAGMRERLTELGGTLEVQSGPKGTRIRASVPTNACREREAESPSAALTEG